MYNEVLNYLLELIEEKYGDLDDNSGAYIINYNKPEDRQWEYLSVAEIVSLIEQADEKFSEDEDE